MAGVDGLSVSNENGNSTEDGPVRLLKLRSALDKTAKSCVSALGYNLFKAHFKPKCRDEKAILQDVHSQFQERALALVKDEVVLMIREENVEQLLLKLEALCKLSQTQDEEVLWRPKGVPVDDVSAQLLPGLFVLRQKLNQQLYDVDSETDRMKRAVVERRRLIDSLKMEIAENVKLLCQDTEEINDILQYN